MTIPKNKIHFSLFNFHLNQEIPTWFLISPLARISTKAHFIPFCRKLCIETEMKIIFMITYSTSFIRIIIDKNNRDLKEAVEHINVPMYNVSMKIGANSNLKS